MSKFLNKTLLEFIKANYRILAKHFPREENKEVFNRVSKLWQ